jgi:hypothetical protein
VSLVEGRVARVDRYQPNLRAGEVGSLVEVAHEHASNALPLPGWVDCEQVEFPVPLIEMIVKCGARRGKDAPPELGHLSARWYRCDGNEGGWLAIEDRPFRGVTVLAQYAVAQRWEDIRR